MNDEQLRQAYEGWLSRQAGTPRTGHPDGEALLALAERTGAEDQRLATLDHAMACPECRRDLEMLRSVVDAGRKEGVVRRPAWQSGGLRAAAAVALLAVTGSLVWIMARGDKDVLRGEIGAVAGVSPQGDVRIEDAQRLIWRPLAGTTRYDVELLTDRGTSMLLTISRDTSVLIPSGTLKRGQSYIWTIRAQRPDGNQAEAVPLRFRVMP